MSYKLDEQQIEAVNYVDSPLCILADVGTGKTTVLANKMVHLVQDDIVSIDSILAICPTKQSAKYLESLSKPLFGKRTYYPCVHTFESFSAEILRKENPKYSHSIYNTSHQLRIIKDILDERNNHKNISFAEIEKILNYIKFLKNNMILPHEVEEKHILYKSKQLAKIYQAYQTRLKINKALDFEDTIWETIKLLDKKAIRNKIKDKFKYIIIDEYESITLLQNTLIKNLADNNITIAGDPNQSIGGKQGVSTNYLLSFNKSFPKTKTINLKKNYRSVKTIQLSAASLLQDSKSSSKNKQINERPITYYLAYDELDEANYIAKEIKSLIENKYLNYRDIYVLFRNYSQRNTLEKVFTKNHFPIRSNTNELLINPSIIDIINYLYAINNLDDNESIVKVFRNPIFEIDETTISNIMKLSNTKEKSIYYLFANDELNIEAPLKPKLANIFNSLKTYKISLKSDTTTNLCKLIKQLSKFSGLEENLKNENTLSSIDELEKITELCYFIEDNKFCFYSFLDYFVFNVKNVFENNPGNAVSLLPINNAKGLESEAVFITGVEEGLIPHFETLFNQEAIEEENRLFYIGITRAKRFLTLSSANHRVLFGETWHDEISRFISKIPHEYIACFVSEQLEKEEDVVSKKLSPITANFQFIKEEKEIESAKKAVPFFNKGAIIQHEELGQGEILNVEGEGNNSILSILFGDEEKKLMAKYAKLKLIKE
jgi:DNA helicase II / ATP-dependent DNA helicase PcrA